MSRYKKNLGDFGEYVATDFLEAKGYRILERNFQVKGGEIDIVAETKNWLVFVEVKTRKSVLYGQPAESVDFRKQQHLLTAARMYLYQHPTQKDVRFDVIEVYATFGDGCCGLSHINHIENVIMEGN